MKVKDLPEGTKLPRETYAARFLIQEQLQACAECLYLLKLSVHKDEDKWFIGRGCHCPSVERLSEYYDDQTDARLALASGTWRN